MTVELNKENFDPVISEGGIVLVRCWASWCRNCDEDAEAYRRASEKHPKHVFAMLDTQQEKQICTALNIRHVPSLLLFRDGLLLFKQSGSYDEKALDDIVDQAESLNMDEVRAALSSALEEAGTGAA